jgi:hypothetical protein
MNAVKISSFFMLALAVAVAWQVSSASEVPTPSATRDDVGQRPSRCAERGAVTTSGPLTLEESGAPAGAWGKCIDCSDCLGPGDCVHVGSPCYEQCP